MPKVAIDCDARYPDYILGYNAKYASWHIDVDDKTLARWERAISNYNKVMNEIAKAIGDD